MPVINKYHYNGVDNVIPKYAINIMRGTIFGNPYPITKTKDRKTVIEEFKQYAVKKILVDEYFKNRVKELHGQTLCCCCAPLPCHGDVLLELAARLIEEEGENNDQ